MVCLHILTLERLAYSQALYLCHSLQAHAFRNGVDDSLAHHPTLRQVRELGDWTILYDSFYLTV